MNHQNKYIILKIAIKRTPGIAPYSTSLSCSKLFNIYTKRDGSAGFDQYGVEVATNFVRELWIIFHGLLFC